MLNLNIIEKILAALRVLSVDKVKEVNDAVLEFLDILGRIRSASSILGMYDVNVRYELGELRLYFYKEQAEETYEVYLIVPRNGNDFRVVAWDRMDDSYEIRTADLQSVVNFISLALNVRKTI
jgi:predicted Co/Zn/Cd cation transporter (cation efflux family)